VQSNVLATTDTANPEARMQATNAGGEIRFILQMAFAWVRVAGTPLKKTV
jgi:hypothetical protein